MSTRTRSTLKRSMPHRFTSRDFQSADGFLTSVWGPSLWMTLHTISLNYPCKPSETQRKQYKAFFDSLKHVLPCGKCRENLHDNLIDTNYGDHVFTNRDSLSKWVHALHSNVNKMLGKPNNMTYDSMRQTYEHFRARCNVVTGSRQKKKCTEAAAINAAKTMIGGGRVSRTKRNKSQLKRRHAKHGGCTQPLSGVKSRCVLQIVPAYCGARNTSLTIDKRCYRRRHES